MWWWHWQWPSQGPQIAPNELIPIPLTLVNGGEAPSFHCWALMKRLTRFQKTWPGDPSWMLCATPSSLACALPLCCTCSFCHLHGALQPIAFLLKPCKALTTTQEIHLPQGPSSLPRGLAENKSYWYLAHSCLSQGLF